MLPPNIFRDYKHEKVGLNPPQQCTNAFFLQHQFVDGYETSKPRSYKMLVKIRKNHLIFTAIFRLKGFEFGIILQFSKLIKSNKGGKGFRF